jgi:hypothetical protein
MFGYHFLNPHIIHIQHLILPNAHVPVQQIILKPFQHQKNSFHIPVMIGIFFPHYLQLFLVGFVLLIVYKNLSKISFENVKNVWMRFSRIFLSKPRLSVHYPKVNYMNYLHQKPNIFLHIRFVNLLVNFENILIKILKLMRICKIISYRNYKF